MACESQRRSHTASLRVDSPSECYRGGLPTSSRKPAPPMRFFPLQRISEAGTHSPGSYLVPVQVRLQGFPPSCRVQSPASFQPFQAGNAHGVFPFGAFPSRGAVAPLGALCPPVVYRSLKAGAARRSHIQIITGPTSGPRSPRESVAGGRGLAVRPLATPLGFPRSRVFHRCVARSVPRAPLAGLAYDA